MKADSYVKYSLLRSAGHDTNRVQVLVHVFAVVGNGLDWCPDTGEIVSKSRKVPSPRAVNKMKMDLSGLKQSVKEYQVLVALGLGHRISGGLVNAEFELARAKFVQKHVDAIATNIDATLLREYEMSYCHYLRHPSYTCALLFKIPDNVAQDWAKAAFEFASFWQDRLTALYGGFAHKKPEDMSTEMRADWDLFERLEVIRNKMRLKLGHPDNASANAAIIDKVLAEREHEKK
jgi:hypothetical protein